MLSRIPARMPTEVRPPLAAEAERSEPVPRVGGVSGERADAPGDRPLDSIDISREAEERLLEDREQADREGQPSADEERGQHQEEQAGPPGSAADIRRRERALEAYREVVSEIRVRSGLGARRRA
jgi:hypothetical protein